MNIEEFRNYCLSLEGVREKMPFTGVKDKYSRDVLCFYVADKWFCFVNIEVSISAVSNALRQNQRTATGIRRHKTGMAHE